MLPTKEQYHDQLAKMRPNIYIGGEKVGREDPMTRPGIRIYDLVFDLAPAMRDTIDAFIPNYENLFKGLAKESGAVIHGGSQWVLEDEYGLGYNTAQFFSRTAASNVK